MSRFSELRQSLLISRYFKAMLRSSVDYATLGKTTISSAWKALTEDNAVCIEIKNITLHGLIRHRPGPIVEYDIGIQLKLKAASAKYYPMARSRTEMICLQSRDMEQQASCSRRLDICKRVEMGTVSPPASQGNLLYAP